MRNNLKKQNKYEGFSLVEMLITIVIIGVVMLTASTTLTTLIKISTVSSNKTRVRTESEFVLELVRRTVRNSNPSNVYIYDSLEARTYNPDENEIVNTLGADLTKVYSDSLMENVPGNEIHFRPYGYESWICIGYFKSSNDPNMGYIIKTSAQNLWEQQQTCFDNGSDKYLIALNSDMVNINSFDIAYTILKDTNYLIRFDIEAQPIEWYLAPGAPVNKIVHRQTVVSTEGITW